MASDFPVTGSLVIADYVVLSLTLVVSVGIGVFHGWVSRKKESSRDFLTGGQKMTAIPMSLSLTATFMSSITVLSQPAEVYCFGAIIALFGIAYTVSTVLTSEIFLPVFYRLNITSTYEYLELRFNRAARLVGTVFFMIYYILYIGIIIYSPAIVISQVSDLGLWWGIISTGIVCTFYCTLGGLKAVVWTDVFQMGIMLAGFLSVIIKSVLVQGGVSTIISDAQQGGRLNFWDFDMNPVRKYTFWTLVVGGSFFWLGSFGIHQAQVQRYVSCKTITHARVALYISLLGVCSILACAVFAGMCLYSMYKDCDPWTAGWISATDQLMPYLVMDVLMGCPGLPGLFFAAVYSGSLSTVSTGINAMAAVTLEDLIKPYTNMSEKHLHWVSKGLTFFYGVLCTCVAALASVMGGIMQASMTMSGILCSPFLGVFLLGFLCPFANSKGALCGLASGFAMGSYMGALSLLYPTSPEVNRRLPLSTKGCNFTTETLLNWTTTALPTELSYITSAPGLTSGVENPVANNGSCPSFLYFCPIGALTTFTVGVVVSLLTGGYRKKTATNLILLKEDTTLYYLLKYIKSKVSANQCMCKLLTNKTT
ncbi:sodium-coupled monocarboxylate transporter 1-like [Sphaeramia orbicularis]|uniref:sodium-coupled monocarboxylate transporter 1-like n=1 Tax=Sphaeramia orbicularis TaxID=375764 RepID=UPI0011805E37|nr:sodium-coupled monocarboxylate transporter 1-like [Sphaeramia orbicularis]